MEIHMWSSMTYSLLTSCCLCFFFFASHIIEKCFWGISWKKPDTFRWSCIWTPVPVSFFFLFSFLKSLLIRIQPVLMFQRWMSRCPVSVFQFLPWNPEFVGHENAKWSCICFFFFLSLSLSFCWFIFREIWISFRGAQLMHQSVYWRFKDGKTKSYNIFRTENSPRTGKAGRRHPHLMGGLFPWILPLMWWSPATTCHWTFWGIQVVLGVFSLLYQHWTAASCPNKL